DSAKRGGPEASVPSRRYNVFRPAAQSQRGKSSAAISYTLAIRFALSNLLTFHSGHPSYLKEAYEVFIGVRIIISSFNYIYIDLKAI
ncbi:hypothetical protein CGCVW01_v001317, partial [Colletotrichum viniferum]